MGILYVPKTSKKHVPFANKTLGSRSISICKNKPFFSTLVLCFCGSCAIYFGGGGISILKGLFSRVHSKNLKLPTQKNHATGNSHPLSKYCHWESKGAPPNGCPSPGNKALLRSYEGVIHHDALIIFNNHVTRPYFLGVVSL